MKVIRHEAVTDDINRKFFCIFCCTCEKLGIIFMCLKNSAFFRPSIKNVVIGIG